MAVFQNNLLAGAGAQSSDSTYKIDQSIRFNLADTTYMQRTHGAGGNADLATVSFWFKRSTFGVEVTMFGTGANVYNTFDIYFKTDNTMVIQNYAGSYQLRLITNQVFRDPSAWYHLVFVYDSAHATASERARLYINGARVSSFSTATYPSQNQDAILGTNVAIGFGRYISYGSSNTNQYFPGYLAEMHYVNGYGYGPEYFGETNDNGIWVPKEYSESYGTGGFKVDGRDSSDLGDDESGQGNDLTTSGLAAHDQVSDSPTNNFATFNSVYNDAANISSVTYKNGNLQADATSSQFDHTASTFNLPKSGKWYFEQYLGGRYTGFGICIVGQEASITSGYSFGSLSTAQGFGFQDNVVYNGNSATVTFGGQSSLGDILNCAFDVDNNKVFLGINGTYYAADNGDDGNPSAGTNPTVTTSFSLSTNDIILGFYFSTADGTSFVNFGQEGTFGGNKTAGGNSDANGIGNFFNTVPTSYLALCSKNVGS